MSKPVYDRTHHAKMATGVGDPQCFSGKAGDAKFKVGDRVRVRDLPDIFYTRTMTYARGLEGTVVELVYESPPAENEAWDNTEVSEWFYSVVFSQHDIWPAYSVGYPNDTLETEFSERWLEAV
jgi:thiocyanate hydrolase subunit alpha